MQDVQLINRIGVRLGSDAERILDRLDCDAITEADIEYTPDHVASDHDYARHVRDIDADTPGRLLSLPRLKVDSGQCSLLHHHRVRNRRQ